MLSLLAFSSSPCDKKMVLLGANIILNTNTRGGKGIEREPSEDDSGDPKYANTIFFILASNEEYLS